MDVTDELRLHFRLERVQHLQSINVVRFFYASSVPGRLHAAGGPPDRSVGGGTPLLHGQGM